MLAGEVDPSLRSPCVLHERVVAQLRQHVRAPYLPLVVPGEGRQLEEGFVRAFLQESSAVEDDDAIGGGVEPRR